ncbi:hypothetical protein [Streptomyces sp. SP17KL33]|uniref:hypothetical protein n=1 Tax=Streptomyces sp. SP17KL33 TaxID=3002534 RepID=UPI002E78AD78|nr:hypothetical protein [Streptomyces sp. SP17KL33]MEE1829482.1 hypothetical protein [Streptomyces sp. SP17KL33]
MGLAAGASHLVRVLKVRHAGHRQDQGEGVMRLFACGDEHAVIFDSVIADGAFWPGGRD